MTLCAAILLYANKSHGASSVRFALVVGNNRGIQPSKGQLSPLRHAESEARKLGNYLVRYGNFDPAHVLVVTGQGREGIFAAAKTLAGLHRSTRKSIDHIPTLFALFFTGHGEHGGLLTRDGPLTGVDLVRIFKTVDATINIGFFDACYAESLGREGLFSKGAISTPGFNPLQSLPQEVLRSEGNLWFVSSRPEEQSFEDAHLGGLLTHYFIEAFTQTPYDGIAITLEEMWRYASRRAAAHAAKYQKKQTPVRIIQHFKERAPIFFSFPKRRTAKIRFAAELDGLFFIRYQDGALTEKVLKVRGQPLEVALYAGAVEIQKVPPRGSLRVQSARLKLEGGKTIQLCRYSMFENPPSLGYGYLKIRSKGALNALTLLERKPRLSLGPQLSFGFAFSQKGIQASSHQIRMGTFLVNGPFSTELDFVFGKGSGVFEDWSYSVSEWGGRGLVGAGMSFGPLRLDLEGGSEITFQQTLYTDGNAGAQNAYWVGGGLRASCFVPEVKHLALQVRAGVGGLFSKPVAVDENDFYWSLRPYFEIGASFPISFGPERIHATDR